MKKSDYEVGDILTLVHDEKDIGVLVETYSYDRTESYRKSRRFIVFMFWGKSDVSKINAMGNGGNILDLPSFYFKHFDLKRLKKVWGNK